MAKVTITLELSPEADRLLGHLVEHGLFGAHKVQVAEEMLRAKLRETVLEGWAGTVGYGDGRTMPLIQPPG